MDHSYNRGVASKESMETKANYLLVTVFSLVVCALAFGFFYWVGRYGETRETSTLEIRVPGSVTGLAANSPVFFNGLKVGEVKRLFIDSTNPDAVIVQTAIDLDHADHALDRGNACLRNTGRTGAHRIDGR